MNVNDFSNILKNPQGISSEQIREITSILEEYPYFHAARALHLKILYAQKDYKYNRALKVAAAHITNRTVLYDFINSHASTIEIIKQDEEISTEITEGTFTNTKKSYQIPAWFYDISVISEEILPNEQSSDLHIDNENEPRSFSEWLQITRYAIPNSDENTTLIDENKKNKFELIDRFLETNPKIEPSKDYVPSINITDNSGSEEPRLMTETLAKVYLEQRKFKEAIQAYEILILKNPEKSGFFADQIRAIKNLQQNNS